MGYTLQMVRFPAAWVPSLRSDRAAAIRVALDGVEGAVMFDFGRSEDAVYALLRPSVAQQILLVTRPDDPLAHALVGAEWLQRSGTPIDTGYGTPYLVAPEEVSVIAGLLEPLDAATLTARGQGVADVAWLVARALELRSFYVAAAAEGQAVVITPC